MSVEVVMDVESALNLLPAVSQYSRKRYGGRCCPELPPGVFRIVRFG